MSIYVYVQCYYMALSGLSYHGTLQTIMPTNPTNRTSDSL